MALCYHSYWLLLCHCSNIPFQMSPSASQLSTDALYYSWSEPNFSIYCINNSTVPYINTLCINQLDLQLPKPAEILFTVLLHPFINHMLVPLVPSRLEWSPSYRQKLYYIHDSWHLYPFPLHHFTLCDHQRNLYRLYLHDVSAHFRFIHPHLKQTLRHPRWLPIHTNQIKTINQDRNVASPYLFHLHLNLYSFYSELPNVLPQTVSVSRHLSVFASEIDIV